MTRPHIIRADTIDLQDKNSPTAQDHSQQPEHPAPLGIGPAAPHQQAAIRHVEEERSSEEARLQHAWSNAGSALRDDPGSDDDRTLVNQPISQRGMQHDQQANKLNGGVSGNGDDGDMHDGDDDEDDDDMDDDDDMMDKISSSPSIDDGGCFLPYSATWPARQESLTPRSSPTPSIVASSSLFTSTPVHFPISVADACRPFGVPARDTSHMSGHDPAVIPISFRFSSSKKNKSTEHRPGEYAWTRTTIGQGINADIDMDPAMSPRSKQLTVVERRLQIMREDSQGSLISDLDDEQISNMLKPLRSSPVNEVDDPFLEPTASPARTSNGTPPLPKVKYSEDDEDSWTTDSDADSWEEDLDQHNDDASKDISFSEDPRFIDSGWGGECLRETEDIDFEFVYALHTFVATVEGQANATKGDTMVLLDDSNSYWWLVRVVKDSSIGYLPAEHIETPTERLARLNKHRNIDLSATMLGDTAEKSKNPLKKAMRRRNAKTVQFAPPTYVEASDYDYSSDEGDGELFGGPEPKQVQQQQQQSTQKDEVEAEDGLKVQPLKANGVKEANGQSESEARSSSENGVRKEDERQRESEDSVDRPLDPKVSRNGTLRNTDSFFKDENTETRKITLTPNILRDDSNGTTTVSKERGPSLESLEKNGFADKVKDDKKKKEKKSGMLSGLFKRKDKKVKGGPDSVDSDIEKPEDMDRSSLQSKASEESTERQSAEQTAPTSASAPAAATAAVTPAPLRQSSKGKLQKSQRIRDDSPQKTKGILKTANSRETTSPTETELEESSSKLIGPQPAPTMRVVSPEDDNDGRPSTDGPPAPIESRSAMNVIASRNPFSSTTKTHEPSEAKPAKAIKSKQRVQLDDFDSDDESNDPFADPDAEAKSAQAQDPETTERLSESPVHVSAADAQPSQKAVHEREREPDPRQPPGLTTDSSSQETSSPISTPTPDDSPMKTIPENSTLSSFQAGNEPSRGLVVRHSAVGPPPSRPAPVPDMEREPSPPDSSESSMLPAWSDASLRAYLDDGSDIRDMLLVVNDTTGVVPVSREHPFMKNLFVQEMKTMQGLSHELDSLLNGLMDKRMRRAGSGASKASTARSMSANGNLNVNGR